MGRRSPCCAKVGLNRGTWSAVEDRILTDYINANGEGNWRNLPKIAGLKRCGKSCRLRWMNYLRPSIKRGNISPDEEDLITRLHKLLGNRWSLIAGRLPGRTDNEIKNYWNTILRKKVGAKPTAARKTKRSDATTDTAGGTDGCRPHAASRQAERTRASSAPEPRSPVHPPPIRTKAFRCTQAVTKMFMSTQQPPPSDNGGGRCPDDYEEEGPPACDPPTYTLFRSNSFTLSSFLMEEGGDRDPNDNSHGFFVSDDCTTTGTCRSNQQLIGSDRPIHVTEELDDGRDWSSFDLESLIHFLDKEDWP